MADKKTILTKEVAQKKMERMALEIAETLFGEGNTLYLVGIEGSGMVVAQNMLTLLQPLLSCPVELIRCKLDKKKPSVISYSSNPDFTGKNILLVDDVTNSGKTLLYALKPLLDFHPAKIHTLTLVERMHKSFPVKIDYIGLSIATTLQDHIQVNVENGEISGVFLM